MKRWINCLSLPLCCVLMMPAHPADDPYFISASSWEQPFADQWGLHRIGLAPEKNSLQKLQSRAKHNTVVAVIDTGLDYFHPDFAKDNLWQNSDEVANGVDDDGNGFVDDLIGWNFVESHNNPWDRSGHGTHTAGIVAAAVGNGEGIAGVNPRALIMPLKVINFLGRGNSSHIAEAIFYAVNNGARVINLSLGGEYTTRIEEAAINYAVSRGVVVVVASGNTAEDTSNYGYAKLPSVITVAATDAQDRRAKFSNYGQDINLAAPGMEILSLRARRTDFTGISTPGEYPPGGDFVGETNRYYRASGTSFAAPFVTGVASLLFSAYPELTAEQVTRMLLMSARDIETPGWDQLSGYGLVDAAAALDADPDYYTYARISAITPANKEGALVAEISGVADSSRFKSYTLQVGYGAEPEKWQTIGRKQREGVAQGVLGDIPATVFNRKGEWTVRVVVETRGRGSMEARGTLDIE